MVMSPCLSLLNSMASWDCRKGIERVFYVIASFHCSLLCLVRMSIIRREVHTSCSLLLSLFPSHNDCTRRVRIYALYHFTSSYDLFLLLIVISLFQIIINNSQ